MKYLVAALISIRSWNQLTTGERCLCVISWLTVDAMTGLVLILLLRDTVL